MDFTYTAEQLALQKEVTDFVLAELPEEHEEMLKNECTPQLDAKKRAWDKRLAERGYLAFGWPKEYGGGGKTYVEQGVINEVFGYYRVPVADTRGLHLAGPAIIVHGTVEQKKKFLPPIANGEVVYAQGFTEPGSGSDLASLMLKAEEDGDEFVLNGSKLYTSCANHADYCWLATRTDFDAPKHRGISMFIVDLKTPGIDIRPLWHMGGDTTTEVFYDDVRVPAANMVGERNRGWYVIATTLDFERSGVGGAAAQQRTFEEFTEFCREHTVLGRPLIEDPTVRNKLAEVALEIQTYRWVCWRVIWMQGKGLIPNYESSMSNFAGKMTRIKASWTYVEILKNYGLLTDGVANGSKWGPLIARVNDMYRNSFWTHGAGTIQVQKNIIAQRGMGLPR